MWDSQGSQKEFVVAAVQIAAPEVAPQCEHFK